MNNKLDIFEEDACAFLLYKCSKQKLNRNTLRKILKKNNHSYHKPGPKNHMKTVKEMEVLIYKASILKIDFLLNNNFLFNKSIFSL